MNVKFEKFIDVVFNSKMQTVDMKDQIIKYVQALETSYTDAVRELRSQLEKEKKIVETIWWRKKTKNKEKTTTWYFWQILTASSINVSEI